MTAPVTPPGTPFVGRTAELALIAAAADAAAGASPQVVFIEGAAGSGKTALARQAVRALPPGFSVEVHEASELAADVPFELAARMTHGTADSPFAMGVELLAYWSGRQDEGPLVIVVEDLHWADPGSRQAFLLAAQRLDGDRVLLLITSRPDHGADGWSRFTPDPDRCVTVQLGQLTVDEVGVLALTAGVTLTAEQATRLHTHTAGHALYVRTLLRELTADQLTREGADLPAPRSLASATIAGLAQVPEPGRQLAAALAVANQPLPLATLAVIAGVASPVEAVEPLLATGFVQWDPDAPGSPVRFTHPLHRLAVAQDMSPTRRRDLHRAAAGALGTLDALAHRVAATDGPDEALAAELEEHAAGEAATRRTAGLAARHLLWASSLSPELPASERRLINAARAFLRAGTSGRARELLARLEQCIPTAARELALGLLDWDGGDADAAEERLGRAAADEAAEGGTVAARAWAELAEIAVAKSRPREAAQAAGKALTLCRPGTSAERLGWLTGAIAQGMLHGAPAGLADIRTHLPTEAAAVGPLMVDVLVVRAMLALYAGQLQAALDDTHAVLRLARQGSTPVQIARAHFQLATLLLATGDWDGALVNARVASSLGTESPSTSVQPQSHAVVAVVSAGRGEWEAATEQLAMARQAAGGVTTPESFVHIRMAGAALARARRQPDEVVRLLDDLPGLAPRIAGLAFWPPLVQAYIDLGHTDQARDQLRRFEAGATERGLDLGARISGLAARLAVATAQPAEARAHFAAALAAWGPDHPYLEGALLRHAYGRFLSQTGESQDDRHGAIEQLQAASRLLEALGARPDLAAVEADLAAAGQRPAAPRGRSSLGLTERERDVAVLVAKGLSNPEVATELYISRKAVEYHLGHVYGKLGIRSRRELRTAAL